MEIIMPSLGETVDEGKVVKWLKKVGDELKREISFAKLRLIRQLLRYLQQLMEN